MTHEFEIIKVIWHHNRGDFIFARHLGDTHDLEIPDGSLFGDVPIYHYIKMRSLKDENGALQPDIFVLKPMSMKWLVENHFIKGQRVKLITRDTS